LADSPEAEYFALAWLNDSGGCEFNRMGPSKTFKGCLSIKDTTSINLESGKKLAVFEGFLDFLAYLTHFGITEYQNSAIILNTLSMKDRLFEAISTYRFEEMYLFLDNDDGGHRATETLKKAIPNIKIHDKSSLYSGYKDFNDMVMDKPLSK